MRISNQQPVFNHYPQSPPRESDIIITYPASRHNMVRDEYIIEDLPVYSDAIETVRNVNTYSFDNGTVSLNKKVSEFLVDVYA